MSEALYEADIDLAPLKNRQVYLIGYGNHGRAHALNLRDQGIDVAGIALRGGSPSQAKAEADGFQVVGLRAAAVDGDVVAILAADEAHGEIYHQFIEPCRKKPQSLIFCHGFSIEYGVVKPPGDCDVILAAAKGPGGAVRSSFEKGGGLVGFWAVHQDATGEAEVIAKAYLAGIGCGRAGIFPTSFREEALADILGEQAVLVGGMCALARTGFETLVKAGISPRMAYIDTVHELKYIADLIHERGIAGMYAAISDTAEAGSHEVEGPISKAVQPVFDDIVARVTSGDFARVWVKDYDQGRKAMLEARAKVADHALEAAGEELRRLLKTQN